MFIYHIVENKVHITGWEGNYPSRLDVPETLGGDPVSTVEEWAFANAMELETLSLPEGLEELGWYALDGCRHLTHVELPDTLWKLGGSAFKNCSSLKSLRLPAGLTELGSHFVEGCSALETFEISADNQKFKEMDGIVYDRSGKTLICAPPGWLGEYISKSGLERIEGEAFWGCGNVEGIELDESVEVVGNHAFYACPIKSLTLSKGLREMGEWAFGRGAFLKELKLPVETELPDDVLAKLRRCLEGRELQLFQGSLRALDRLFDERQKAELVFSYAVKRMPANAEASKVYDIILGQKKEKILQKIFDRDAVEGLHTMEKLGLINTEEIFDLQDQASRKKASHCQLFLLDYQNRKRNDGLNPGKGKWEIDF